MNPNPQQPICRQISFMDFRFNIFFQQGDHEPFAYSVVNPFGEIISAGQRIGAPLLQIGVPPNIQVQQVDDPDDMPPLIDDNGHEVQDDDVLPPLIDDNGQIHEDDVLNQGFDAGAPGEIPLPNVEQIIEILENVVHPDDNEIEEGEIIDEEAPGLDTAQGQVQFLDELLWPQSEGEIIDEQTASRRLSDVSLEGPIDADYLDEALMSQEEKEDDSDSMPELIDDQDMEQAPPLQEPHSYVVPHIIHPEGAADYADLFEDDETPENIIMDFTGYLIESLHLPEELVMLVIPTLYNIAQIGMPAFELPPEGDPFWDSARVQLTKEAFNTTLTHRSMGKKLLKEFGKETMNCAICQETMTSRKHVTILGCKHAFCKGCIREWLTEACETPTCPCCRKDVRDMKTYEEVRAEEIKAQEKKARQERRRARAAELALLKPRRSIRLSEKQRLQIDTSNDRQTMI